MNMITITKDYYCIQYEYQRVKTIENKSSFLLKLRGFLCRNIYLFSEKRVRRFFFKMFEDFLQVKCNKIKRDKKRGREREREGKKERIRVIERENKSDRKKEIRRERERKKEGKKERIRQKKKRRIRERERQRA